MIRAAASPPCVALVSQHENVLDWGSRRRYRRSAPWVVGALSVKAPMSKLGPKGSDLESIEVGGRALELGLGWNRGEQCRYSPALATMLRSTAVEDHILQGWLPRAPLIGRTTRVIASGSCFAQKFANHLLERQYCLLNGSESNGGESNAHVVRIHAGMTTTFSMRQHLEWALEGKVLDQPFWHGFDADALGFDEEARRAHRSRYLRAEVFILTFGLAEIWEDKVTGEAFWRAVPRDQLDPARHVFRVSSVTENLENLRFIYRTIRRHCPTAQIVVTLSPVPLQATFRRQSCIAANTVSKAILRAAIDSLWHEVCHEGFLHYWPSYEIVTEAFEQRFRPDRRYIKDRILNYIMLLFEKHYCHDHTPDFEHELLQAFIEARAVSGSLKFEVVEALKRRDLPWLQGRVKLACENGNYEFIEPVLRRCCQLFPDEAEFHRRQKDTERALGGALRRNRGAGS